MKEIYIILTYTGTILSKLVKIYTKKEYSHVSISLDKELTKMYSFGRLNPYNAFVGGFVNEGQNKGTFKRFKNTKTKIYSLKISEEQYEKLEQTINIFIKNKEKYKFNIKGLIGVTQNKIIKRENYFYCAEFIKYVLEEAKIMELPEIIKPEDFYKIPNGKEIYTGKLKDYNKDNKEEKC